MESKLKAEGLKDYKKAGKITGQAREYGRELIKPGASSLEICKKIEAKIKELGGEPAFPVQLSLNEVAAHFCPEDESIVLKDKDLVKLDLGAHINGFIGDTACTVDLSGENTELIKAAEEALEKSIPMVKAGVKTGEIGAKIQEVITGYGFTPIRNLGGHGLSAYNIHDEPKIPNIEVGESLELEEGQIIAIEPFATTGAGFVFESDNPTIFSLIEKKPVRLGFVRKIQEEIEKYNGLPFTTWWLKNKGFSLAQIRIAMKQLRELEAVQAFPPLIDKARGMVSQAEHTLLVKKNGCEILTKA